MKFLAALTLLLSSCAANLPLLEDGVSLELAQWRSKVVSDLRYELYFNIPSQRDSSVTGILELTFVNDSDVIPALDFRADETAVSSVKLNGKDAAYSVEKEHLSVEGKCRGNVSLEISFTSPDQSLNRREDLMYTLLVPERARTLFPCFDQPDLKARYTLSLSLPDGWKAVSSTAVDTVEGRLVRFMESEPLSTYLFSFAAGRFETATECRNGRKVTMYHRENDPLKLAQIPEIFDEVYASLEWMEEYTGIPYPFGKYDFVVIPGFQYGGMEHTGDTFYNDTRIFLPEGAGDVRKINRSELIAHEVSHMWFGDYATMRWFDDVWTKEVFANWFSAQMIGDWYPDVDRSMDFVTMMASAYKEDRTEGTAPIKRHLDNLADAGLVYDNVIYDKSPIVMEMLARMLGKDNFRKALKEYLTAFAFGSEDWNDIAAILNEHCDKDVLAFSKVWICEKGMPKIAVSGGGFVQSDPLNRGLVWPQEITSYVIKSDRIDTVSVFLEGETVAVEGLNDDDIVIPNIDVKAYGFFVLGAAQIGWCFNSLINGEYSSLEKASMLINLYENAVQGDLPKAEMAEFLLRYLAVERDEILLSYAIDFLSDLQILMTEAGGVEGFDKGLMNIVADRSVPEASRREALLALASGSVTALDELYAWFVNPESFLEFRLSEDELTTLAFELAIRRPEQASEIISQQRERISNPDRINRFDFIARAVSSDENALDDCFASLMEASNRRIEPWAASALHYLNHPLRASRSEKYIVPGLDILPEIQHTGDIFFPSRWASNLLGGHTSDDVKSLVDDYFMAHPHYPVLLKDKVYQAFYLTIR